MSKYNHILLATDLHDESCTITQQAADMAEMFSAKLSLVHVVESMPAYAGGYMGIVNLEQELQTQARQELAELGKVIKVPEADQHLVVGSPKAMILETAQTIGADLLMMGSHGRHGLSRLLGSTATAVLQGASMDTLVIKPHK